MFQLSVALLQKKSMTAMNSYNTCSVDSQNVLQVQSYHPQLW